MKLTGGQIVIKVLEEENIPYILGIPGHGILGLFDAITEAEQLGKIKYIQVKKEQSAVHMADAYFRVKGEPLAVFTSIGPGALNTAIGVATAYVDSTSLLLLSGDTHVHMKGTGVLQEIERYQDSNFIRAMEPIAKRCWRVESVEQLPRILKRAFGQMLTGRGGPVVVSLPMDVQAHELEAGKYSSNLSRAGGKPAGDQAYIDVAAEVMAQAKRPVILAGGAMLRSGRYNELVALAELWGAAVVTTMAGKSAFPEDHPLYGFHTGSKGTPVGLHLTREADVVLALGVRFADETTCSYRRGVAFDFEKTKLIHVDIDPHEIGKNYNCSVGIVGDLSLVIKQLTDALAKAKPEGCAAPGSYQGEIKEHNEKWRAAIEEKRAKDCGMITISQLVGVLNTALPKEAIIVTSSGNTQTQIFQEYVFSVPGTHLTTGGFSTMGWALPAALGAKLAKPGVPVVAVMGDGDFMMCMQEMSTAVQYDIPIIVVLANNMGWIAIKDLQTDVFGKERALGNDWIADGKLYSPDFAAIGNAFGMFTQSAGTQEEVAQALNKAVESGKPSLITVDVYRDHPDSGGGAYGWWDVPIPAHLEVLRKKYIEEMAGEDV